MKKPSLEKEKYLKELKNLIHDDGQNILEDRYYEYKIRKWNNFSDGQLTKYIYPDSETWQLQFNRINDSKEKEVYICFRLKNISIWEGYPPYYANIVMIFRNVKDMTCYEAKTITSEITYFNKDNYTLYFPNFIKESSLYQKNGAQKSIIENNKLLVGFYVRYYKDKKRIDDMVKQNHQLSNNYYTNDAFHVSNIEELNNNNVNNQKKCLRKDKKNFNLTLDEIVVQNNEDTKLVIKIEKEPKRIIKEKEEEEKRDNNDYSMYYCRYLILAFIIVVYNYYYIYY